jgi:hypothetical protein
MSCFLDFCDVREGLLGRHSRFDGRCGRIEDLRPGFDRNIESLGSTAPDTECQSPMLRLGHRLDDLVRPPMAGHHAVVDEARCVAHRQ